MREAGDVAHSAGFVAQLVELGPRQRDLDATLVEGSRDDDGILIADR